MKISVYWLFLSFGVTKYLAEATSKGFSCLGSQFHHKEAMAEFMVGTTAEQTREQEELSRRLPSLPLSFQSRTDNTGPATLRRGLSCPAKPLWEHHERNAQWCVFLDDYKPGRVSNDV